MTPYWLSLGEFISEYAGVERRVQQVLWRVANVDEIVAKSIFSGTRPDAAKDFINRIYEGREQNIDQWLKKAFDQLGYINSARNDIIHYGIRLSGLLDDPETPLAYTTNKDRVIASRAKVQPVSLTILRDLIEDCATLSACLQMYEHDNGSPDWGYLIVMPTAMRTWRYKPHVPSSPPRKRREQRPKPERPLGSLPE